MGAIEDSFSGQIVSELGIPACPLPHHLSANGNACATRLNLASVIRRGGCNQHAQHTNAPRSHDRGYQAPVTSVVRRGGLQPARATHRRSPISRSRLPSTRGLRRQTGGAATSTRHTPTLPDLTIEATKHTWPPSSDGGAAVPTVLPCRLCQKHHFAPSNSRPC
jgi:hypothetical protein